MATNKGVTKGGKRAGGAKGLGPAIARGRRAAAEVIAFRARQQRQRATVTARMARPRAMARIPERTRRALGSAVTAGVLIAEGDSWFDYPMHDVLRLLEDTHGYDVESVAHMGDCVEDMAYSGNQFEEFARRLEKLLRNGKVPRAILLSGGGNDIAGDEFAILINHALSSLPPINDDIVRGVIDVRLRDAYAFMIGGLTAISQQYLNRSIPVVMHGYDYPVPDGRGVLGGWGPLPGPWLRPGFHKKGHGDQVANGLVMKRLIDRFNVMLQEVSTASRFKHVHYLNLRGTLRNDPGNYKKDWGNELHPTGSGFELVAGKFASVIGKL